MAKKKEMSDEEFIAFINANKERMKALMGEDEGVKAYLKGTAKKAKSKVEEAEEKTEDTVKRIFNALFSEDVQKHMIGAGVEFVLGLNALAKAMPVPERAQDAVDKISEVRENVSKTYCAKNPDCPRKKAETKKTTAKKIELD